MTGWQEVSDTAFAVPDGADLDGLADELAAQLVRVAGGYATAVVGRASALPTTAVSYVGLVERVAAGARPGGVRVLDGEALLLDGVHKVDGRAAKVGDA